MATDDPKNPGADPDQDATFQMTPDQVAKLHAQLAAASASAPAARPPAPGPAAAAPPPAAAPARPAAAAPARPAAAAPPPAYAPSAPAAAGSRPPAAAPHYPPPGAHASGGNGALVVGGVGGILLMLALLIGVLPLVMRGDRDVAEILKISEYVLSAIGYALFATGLIGAARRSNATAGVAAIFAYLAALVILTTFTLIVSEAIRDMDLLQILFIASATLPALAWIMTGIWGLTSTRALGGGVGVTLGIFALIGGIMSAIAFLLPFLEIDHMGGDMFAIFYFTGVGATFVAAIMAVIAFFGPLKNAVRA